MKGCIGLLGKIFLGIIVLIAVGIGLALWKCPQYDREAKSYGDVALPAIVTDWNQKELLSRASPELKSATKGSELDDLFTAFTGKLGKLRNLKPGKAYGSYILYTTMDVLTVTTSYEADADFEKGAATLNLSLIKSGGNWQINGIHVDSPALLK